MAGPPGGQTFSTFPALMHDVHTLALRELVPCFTLTCWMLGNQRRLDRLCEKLTFLPYRGPLPHTSQRWDIGTSQKPAEP